MNEKLLAALRQLDVNNDNHWTADGLPRLDTLKFLAGEAVTREAVSATLPGFSRATATELLAGDASNAGSAAQAAPGPVPAPTPSPPPAAPPSEPASGTQQAVQGTGDGNGGQQTNESDAARAHDGAREAQEAAQSVADPKERLAALQEHHARALDYHTHATRILAEAQAALDRELEAQSATGGSTPLHESLTGYFASQQLLRDQRAARIEAMKGVRLSEILPTKANIDKAFERRTGRGTKRPTQL